MYYTLYYMLHYIVYRYMNNNKVFSFLPIMTICIVAHTCYMNTQSQMLLTLYSHFHTSADCVRQCVQAGLCVCAFPSWISTVDDDLMCQVSFTPVLARDTVKLIEPKH